MTASVRAPIVPICLVSFDPAIDAISIVTINGSTGMRIALIHTVPNGSMNFGIAVVRRRTPATNPATRAIAT